MADSADDSSSDTLVIAEKSLVLPEIERHCCAGLKLEVISITSQLESTIEIIRILKE
jgi:hypothetical protein